ncbi:hypothetical protein IFM61606_09065 [Aspergillus udagawae]|uniref:Uncharacterized protein n=1 Tax=Aspergillus udagawae TaxID=91492 RepID=A0ABQ1AAL1_9EURO|nr:hypothetical protein IFM61606_09065 [Aspergillus udagawae]GFF77540.1 hypothetical protein IFM53868_02115 [Aspergillus udagawae]GFG08907.1 hypothetical protein IFM5058_04157 [Aspergillus udagawae]
MTTRNLNRTWRDVVFAQYAADLETNEPFPIRYLINAPEWKKDIFINVPKKISLEDYRRSIHTFCRARYRDLDPAYEDENLSIQARVSRYNQRAEKIDNEQDAQESQNSSTCSGDARCRN